jgi:hypothetical protein
MTQGTQGYLMGLGKRAFIRPIPRKGNVEAFNLAVQQNLGIVIVVVGVVAIAALVLAIMNRSRVGFVARRFAWASEDRASSSTDTLLNLLEAVESNIKDIRTVQSALKEVIAESRTHFKKVGLVRYDAFDGIAGQQSYSLCLLDDQKSGILISNLVGNNFNRGYAVEIKGGGLRPASSVKRKTVR